MRIFELNLELISCAGELFKKLKVHSKRLVQFQLFEKLTSAS